MALPPAKRLLAVALAPAPKIPRQPKTAPPASMMGSSAVGTVPPQQRLTEEPGERGHPEAQRGTETCQPLELKWLR